MNRPFLKPHPIEVEVIKVKNIWVRKDDEHKDGRFEIEWRDGFHYNGMLVKDLYRTKEWHKIIRKLKPLYMGVHGGMAPLQIDVWYENRWHTIWDKSNDFESFAEEKKSTDDYENFILKEGKKIQRLIDQGKTYAQINKSISRDHSGNTYGWAMSYGISKAKNRDNAEKMRLAHNKECGGY